MAQQEKIIICAASEGCRKVYVVVVVRVSHFKLRIRLLMAIFSSTAVQCGYFHTNDVMLVSVYVGQIYFLQISELASMKQPLKDSLQLAKPTRNSRKIANKLTTVASGEINMQSKHNLVCHVPKGVTNIGNGERGTGNGSLGTSVQR